LATGACAPPVWKDVHALMSALNSSVKNCGTGVGVSVEAGVTVNVAMTGAGGVCVAVIAVESILGATVTPWQAMTRTRHPIKKSFFIRLSI